MRQKERIDATTHIVGLMCEGLDYTLWRGGTCVLAPSNPPPQAFGPSEMNGQKEALPNHHRRWLAHLSVSEFKYFVV